MQYEYNQQNADKKCTSKTSIHSLRPIKLNMFKTFYYVVHFGSSLILDEEMENYHGCNWEGQQGPVKMELLNKRCLDFCFF